MKILITLLLFFSISIFSQDADEDDVSAPSEEAEEETVSTPLFDDSSQQNFLELKFGANQYNSKINPGLSLLYQRSVASNFDLGVSLKSILLSRQIERFSAISNLPNETTVNPLTIVGNYVFYRNSNFQPFLRVNFGMAFLRAGGNTQNGLTFSVSGGGKYFVQENLYLIADLGVNRYIINQYKDNSYFLDLGFGTVF
jgi:hypothetical protein